MDRLPDLSSLMPAEKDALIQALWAQVQALTARVAELEAKLGVPPKTPDNSSMPPSQGERRTAATSRPAAVRDRAASGARAADGGSARHRTRP